MCEQIEGKHLVILLAHKGWEIERQANLLSDQADEIATLKLRIAELEAPSLES